MQLLLLIHHKVLAIPRMLIHSENNNILLTGNGIYIQIQLGLFTVQGLEGVACCVWAGWNLATDLGKWKKFNHDLWILCQLKCMICSICRPCFKQIYFHDNQTLCSQWEPEEFLMWFWPLANLYVSHKWNICMWKKSNQLNLLFFLVFVVVVFFWFWFVLFFLITPI